MAWYRAGGGGIPSSLKTGMDSVLNKKFGTSTTYPAEDWPDTVNLMGPLPEKTVSGAIVTFSDGADDVPLKSWEVEIAPTLTGKSEVVCTQTGKNLIDFTQFPIKQTNYLWGYRNVGFPLKKGVTYTFSCSDAVSSLRFVSVDEQTVYAQNSDVATDHLTYTPTDDILVVFRLWSSGISVSWVQLEVGSTATAYEPYTAPTVSTVNLGRTIYGGTADVVNGTAEPMNWLNNTLTTQTVNGTTFTINADKSITVSGTPSQQTRVYISQEAITINEAMFFSFGTMPTGTRVFCLRTSGGTTSYPTISPSHTATLDAVYTNFLLEIGTSFDGTAFTIYPLCNKGTSASEYSPYFEPFTFTGQEINSLYGVNNFWADEGDSEVTYRADINLALGGQ